jgi:hypothetical protein
MKRVSALFESHTICRTCCLFGETLFHWHFSYCSALWFTINWSGEADHNWHLDSFDLRLNVIWMLGLSVNYIFIQFVTKVLTILALQDGAAMQCILSVYASRSRFTTEAQLKRETMELSYVTRFSLPVEPGYPQNFICFLRIKCRRSRAVKLW